ncbi:YeeE/YedE family protein [Methanoculleus taiwanensis]|uniref:YeeE/YedE family protein n=1 Tax=Methanoculleus taiwanensis TaxID=1550565 RepID=A0A498GWU0_9EURY|nr:YeeE/YedE thiosulfate transporter family protein [Methanoculleus taiwanensis]RXE55319.1 YeeE/YedE family protein [Methanoculleus taiwanensis]
MIERDGGALQRLRQNQSLQRLLGLVMGVAFGVFLQLGGVTRYDVIIGQLLLYDFTVVKVMLSAVAVGMVGVYLLVHLGLASLSIKPGSIGTTVLGGIIFGCGFAVLGYCPGTVAGAVGSGALDALFGGVVGILIGAAIFAELYPRLDASVLQRGNIPDTTIPELLGVRPGAVIVPMVILIVAVLYGIEYLGL